jgi:2-succinyl-5-enolpyruvyl-6-hydroxy-3-cyclohexene-1-carboxylate synthase
VNEPRAISDSTIETLAADESVGFNWNNFKRASSNIYKYKDTLITPFTNEEFEDFRPEIVLVGWLFLSV